MHRGPFPFQTTKEAWDYFDKAARLHFVRIVKADSENNPEIKDAVHTLRNRDYCARLMYILNMFAIEGNDDSEFDLDWAMLLAKPLSADQARRSINDLIGLGLMTKVEYVERDIEPYEVDESSDETDEEIQRARRGFRRGPGGNTNANTEFDFG
jgi:hypothetical protein